jgi:hypothetical protein
MHTREGLWIFLRNVVGAMGLIRVTLKKQTPLRTTIVVAACAAISSVTRPMNRT